MFIVNFFFCQIHMIFSKLYICLNFNTYLYIYLANLPT
jgi:hypothetical protein